MSDTAILQLPGQDAVELPVITGSEGEKAIDVSKLRSKTGYITLDPGYVNTGSSAVPSLSLTAKKVFSATEVTRSNNLQKNRVSSKWPTCS
jgi:citrate synthase